MIAQSNLCSNLSKLIFELLDIRSELTDTSCLKISEMSARWYHNSSEIAIPTSSGFGSSGWRFALKFANVRKASWKMQKFHSKSSRSGACAATKLKTKTTSRFRLTLSRMRARDNWLSSDCSKNWFIFSTVESSTAGVFSWRLDDALVPLSPSLWSPLVSAVSFSFFFSSRRSSSQEVISMCDRKFHK